MVVVEIKGVPESFDSIEDKFDFLDGLYQQLIDLAEQLNETSISFVAYRVYH